MAGGELFLDGPQAKARDAVHVIFSGEKVRPEYSQPAPSLEESVRLDDLSVLSLRALVRMKLTSFRDKDRTHLRDLIEVGLVDSSLPSFYSEELAARLQHILDHPEG